VFQVFIKLVPFR